jgi:hypothetical protein
MNHPYINSTRVLFSILIIFLFYSCSPDETKLNDNQIFKQHYSLDQYEDSYGEVKGNLTIEWDNFTTSEVEGVKYYEFSTTSKYKDSIVFEMLRSDIIFKLLAWVDTDHLPQLRIVKLLPFKEYEEVDASYINPQNYTGVAYLYDMQAELLQLNIYEYGEKIDALENEELQNKLPNLRTAYCGDMTRQAQGPDNMVRTVSCEGGGGCGYSTRTVNMYTKWYDVYYVNNQPVFAVYLRTTFEGSRTEQYYSCSGGNSSVTQYREELIPKYPEGMEVEIILAKVWEEDIDRSKLDDCIKSILEDLLNSSNGIGMLLFELEENSPDFKWSLVHGFLSKKTPSQTEVYADGTATTFFDLNAVSKSSKVATASFILHESIHAYLAKKYFDGTIDDDYLTTLNDFINEDDEHKNIVSEYMHDIKVSLKEYGNNVLALNLTDQYYSDLAWGGLAYYTDKNEFIDYEWFSELVPNSSDRDRIRNVIEIEITEKNTNGVKKDQQGGENDC